MWQLEGEGEPLCFLRFGPMCSRIEAWPSSFPWGGEGLVAKAELSSLQGLRLLGCLTPLSGAEKHPPTGVINLLTCQVPPKQAEQASQVRAARSQPLFLCPGLQVTQCDGDGQMEGLWVPNIGGGPGFPPCPSKAGCAPVDACKTGRPNHASRVFLQELCMLAEEGV